MDDHQRTRDLGRGRPIAMDADDTLPAEPPPPRVGGPSSPEIRVGTRLGRYLLEEEIGRGGMGVVYAAFDPELGRRIAIKLLRTRATEGSEGRARLQREAQALARLAHPNVISVFDVGAVGDDVFIAMELCTGGTLRDFQAGKPWRELVHAYVAAGRGLAAAHAAGLVHRDFKPDNVLVGADQRLRVTDFGLVRSTGEARVERGGLAADAQETALTEHGTVMGTPMFMAPEQMTGAPVDATADQFALCVALWQALHGEPPFLGVALTERVAEIAAGRRREPRNRAVPARINRAMTRGMAHAPAARWPQLSALLDELEAGMRSRVPWLVGGAALLAVVAVPVMMLARDEPPDPCRAAAAEGGRVWSRQRAAAEAAFAATGAPFAAASFAAIDRRLTTLAGGWQTAMLAACTDARVGVHLSSAQANPRVACLTSRRHRISAIVDELAHADRALLDIVPRVIEGLPSVDACADADVLAGRTPRPTEPVRLATLADLERRVAELDARLKLRRVAGEVDARLALTDAMVAEARAIEYPPVLAESLIARAALRVTSDQADAARKDLLDAAAAATRGGDRGSLAKAYLELLFVDTTVRGDRTSAHQWSELAAAAVEAAGNQADDRAELADLRAELARADGDPAAAVALLEPAVADPTINIERNLKLQATLARAVTDLGDYARAEVLLTALVSATIATMGPGQGQVLGLRQDLANLRQLRGDYPGCIAAHREVLAAREAFFGPETVQVATSLQALGVCENSAGQTDAARDHLLRAVAIYRAARSPEHPDTLAALSDLAGAYHHAGDHARALEINRELVAIRERTLGPDHPDVAQSLVNLAIETKNAGDPAAAVALYQRALAIFEKSLGADHVNVGVSLVNLAEALRLAGRPADAIAALERADRILTTALGPDHPVLTHVWYGRGLAELDRGHPRVALPWLERAVAGRAGADGDPNERAEAELALARGLVAGGGDHRRARTLAGKAITTWRGLGANFDDERTAAATWLATVR